MAPLVEALSLIPELVYDMAGPLGLVDLKEFPVKRLLLKFTPYTEFPPDSPKIFSAISRGQIVFTPYNSFDGLINFMMRQRMTSTVVKIQRYTDWAPSPQ